VEVDLSRNSVHVSILSSFLLSGILRHLVSQNYDCSFSYQYPITELSNFDTETIEHIYEYLLVIQNC